MNIRNVILFGAVGKLLEDDFGLDVRELLEKELTEEEMEAIGESIDSFTDEVDEDKFVEELIKIFKETLDKLRTK